MKYLYRGFMYESVGEGNKTLVSVDIQPEYSNYMGFRIDSYLDWVNSNLDSFNRIVFIYNGPELGFPEESEYVNWLIENGLSEEALEKIEFQDKSYAFFRNAIDAGLDHDEIVKLIQYMVKNNINDSRDISDWSVVGLDDSVVEQMQDNDDALFIPDIFEYVGRLTGDLYLVGGGKDECLLEIELALRAHGKNYQLINKWVY